MVKFAALQTAQTATSNRQDGGKSGGKNLQEDRLAARILEMLREEPAAAMSEIAEKTGASLRSVQRKIKQLKDADAIERIGGRRYGHWIVKKAEEE